MPPLERLFAALEAAGCLPRWKANGSIRATCPLCGHGRSGRGGSLAAREDDRGLAVHCHRCAPPRTQRRERVAWLAELADALGVSLADLGLADMLPADVGEAIDVWNRAIGEAQERGAFRGRRGQTDHRVLIGASRMAVRARSIEFHASQRQVMEWSGVRTRRTVRRSLDRVMADGWLVRVRGWGVAAGEHLPGGWAVKGTQYRLALPAKSRSNDPVSHSAEHRLGHYSGFSGTPGVLHDQRLGPGSNADLVLGGTKWRVLELVAGLDAGDEVTTPQVAERAGVSVDTARRALVRLAGEGVVEMTHPGGRGRGHSQRWRILPAGLGAFLGRAEALGLREQRRARHQREAEEWMAARVSPAVCVVDPDTGEIKPGDWAEHGELPGALVQARIRGLWRRNHWSVSENGDVPGTNQAPAPPAPASAGVA